MTEDDRPESALVVDVMLAIHVNEMPRLAVVDDESVVRSPIAELARHPVDEDLAGPLVPLSGLISLEAHFFIPLGAMLLNRHSVRLRSGLPLRPWRPISSSSLQVSGRRGPEMTTTRSTPPPPATTSTTCPRHPLPTSIVQCSRPVTRQKRCGIGRRSSGPTSVFGSMTCGRPGSMMWHASSPWSRESHSRQRRTTTSPSRVTISRSPPKTSSVSRAS